MNKQEMRRTVRAMAGDRDIRRAQSEMICRHILDSDIYRQSHVIGGYMPMPHEADIRPVLLDALNTGKTLALPLCGQAPYMTLRHVRSMDELVPGRYGILEPQESAAVIQPQQLDLLLVPLEAVDAQGYRLGKGGGYYDCLLGQADVPAIGCALNWQRVELLPRDAWDQPLDVCAAPDGLHCFR